MSDAGAGGLALDDVMFRLTNDRAAIVAALGLCGERFGGIPKHLRCDRLGFNERIAAGASTVLRRSVAVCFACTFTVPLPGS